MSNELFSQIVIGVITVSTTLITAFVIPYLKSKISAQNFTTIITWITVAVEAAEQLYKNADNAGLLKYEYAVSSLKEKGIDIDETELKNLIESAVLKLK